MTILVWLCKLPSTYEQLGDEAASFGSLRTSGPFSGFKDIWEYAPIGKVLLFVSTLVLLGYAKTAALSIFEGYQDTITIFGSQKPTMLLISSGLAMSVPLTILLLPLNYCISIRLNSLLCALAIVLGLLLYAIPTSGWWLLLFTFTGVVLINTAYCVLIVRFIEYTLTASPVGREGSIAAMVSVVWLISRFFDRGLNTVLKSQQMADWTYNLVVAIEPLASNAHALWLIVLVAVLLGAILLFMFREYLFGENSPVNNRNLTD